MDPIEPFDPAAVGVPTGSSDTPPAPPAAPPAPPAPPADAPPADAPAKPQVFEGEFDAPRAQKLIENLRAEVAAAKANRDTAATAAAEKARDDFAREIGLALGFFEDEDNGPDADELVAQAISRAEAAEQKIRGLEVKDAVLAAASKVHGDTTLLLPYLRGEGKLDGLDPSSADFHSQVEALVTETVTANPKLKLGQVPTRSGGDFSGGNSAPPPEDVSDVEVQRKKVRDQYSSTRI